MSWFDDTYGAEEDPEYRRNAVTNKLFAPLGISLKTSDLIGGTPEPAQTEQQAREARERLAAQDRLFGNYPGASVPDIYKLPRNVTAGDPDADGLDDRDAELQSMDEARR